MNSHRVDRQIGGNFESATPFVGADGGIYEFVFGSIDGNLLLVVIFDFNAVFRSDPDGNSSPFLVHMNIYLKKNKIITFRKQILLLKLHSYVSIERTISAGWTRVPAIVKVS